MKNKLLFAIGFCCCISSGFSQNLSPDSIQKEPIVSPPPPGSLEKDDDGEVKVFTRVEQEAEFPGGFETWIKYLTKELGAFNPAAFGAPRGQYTVIAKFIVSKTGKISAVQTETDHGFGMEKAVIKLIKKSPDWKPAMQNGRTVNAYRRQPVTFVVE